MRMPSLGQTTDELRIVAWLKTEGESVKLGEALLEVETDKATLEVESAFSGILLRILRTAEETVLAGSPIAYIGAPGEPLPSGERPSANPATVPPAPDQAGTPAAPVTGAKVTATPT